LELTTQNADFAARQLAQSGDDPAMPQPEYWYPILDHGRERGELRSDLTNGQTLRWIGMMSLMFLQRPYLFPDEVSVEWHSRQFIVPALLSKSPGAPGVRSRTNVRCVQDTAGTRPPG
jgi:hypothetical protein